MRNSTPQMNILGLRAAFYGQFLSLHCLHPTITQPDQLGCCDNERPVRPYEDTTIHFKDTARGAAAAGATATAVDTR
jgi:hypothetical protein